MADRYMLEDDPTRDREALLAQMSSAPTAAAPNQRQRGFFGRALDATGIGGRVAEARQAASAPSGVADAMGSAAGAVGSAAPSMAAPPTPKRDFSQWGQYGGEGLDAAKIARGHDSPKYQIGRVLSNFDPKQGFTPEVMDALNALGIGTFSANKDRLTVGGQMDPRFEGVTGADLIRNFTGDGPAAWQGWGGVNPEGPGVKEAPPAMGRTSGSIGGPASSFQGIQSLVPTDTNTYNTLQARLQQLLGPEASDREALLRMMVQ